MSRNKYPEETVNLILDVAQNLFLEKGYENTTIQDIINGLGGLTKGAIYHHFKSKEEILLSVKNRIFQNSTLPAKWNKIIVNSEMSGGDKLKAMLYEAIADEKEQEFRRMGVNIRKMPHLLADHMLRMVDEVAPQAFQPVLEQGIDDGSVTVPYPKELAEIISMLANVWMNPMIFPSDYDEYKRKFDVICLISSMLGVDLSSMSDAFDKMNKEINKR